MKTPFIFFAVILIFQVFTGSGSAIKSETLKVPERGFVSSKPAVTWEEGLISGNGTIGINILSRPLDETVIFTHERLFLPQGSPTVPPDNSHMLFEIRSLIDRGLYKQATELAFNLSGQESFMYPDPFVPAFDLNLKMKSAGDIEDYMRSVDFQTGEATVHWSDSRGVFERKMFVSRADGMAVLLVTGPKGTLNFELAVNPRKPSDKLDARTISRSYQVFESHVSDIKRTVEDNSLTYRNSFTKAYPGSIHALEGVARVILNDGKISAGRESLEIRDASEVLILIDLEVIYDPSKSVAGMMKNHMATLPADYQILLQRHALIHGGLFNRMKLDLGGGSEHHLTTEELMEKSTNDNLSRALLEKEFDAGRYNIISSVGELPPTLQKV